MKGLITHFEKHPRLLKVIVTSAFLLTVLVAVLIVSLGTWYRNGLQPVSPGADTSQLFQIVPGQNLTMIADNLKQAGLIKDSFVFIWYVKVGEHSGRLQAGYFNLNAGMSVSQIVKHLTSDQAINYPVIISPKQRLDQIARSLAAQGFDQQVVDEILKIDHYRDHRLASYWGPTTSLEGYLAPETFFVTGFALDDGHYLIQRSLDKFADWLETEGLIDQLQAQGLTVHQAVILASIVEQESANHDHQPRIAQVFLKRLNAGDKLGSDVTFIYAGDVFGVPKRPGVDHPYNTRRYPGLTPGPIGNVRLPALQAVANPSSTDYYYFLAGDDGQLYFNKTLDEHLADRDRYCQELCQLPE